MTTSLDGLRIVNTRALHQAGDFDALIQARGAEPVSYPCIAIVPPADSAELDIALTTPHDWLVLTSQNVVLTLADRVQVLDLDWSGMRVAAVGPSTASAACDLLGLTVNLIPDEYVAEALAAALNVQAGARVLLPQSAIARPVLVEALRKGGAQVTAVTAYQTVRGSGGADVVGLLRENRIDAVTFTSPSTARYFVARLIDDGGDLSALNKVCIAAIGPVTAKTISALDIGVTVVPEDYTLDGLLDALAAHFFSPSAAV